MKQEIAKRFESEEHEEIVIDRPQLSHITDDQTNKLSKALELNLLKNKPYTCSVCEKYFNSEKGLKGHMIFSSTLTCAYLTIVIEFLIAPKAVYQITPIFSDPANSVLVV